MTTNQEKRIALQDEQKRIQIEMRELHQQSVQIHERYCAAAHHLAHVNVALRELDEAGVTL